MKKWLSRSLIVFLALTLALLAPAKIYADSAPQYLSEIKVSANDDQATAVAALTGSGYTVLNYDLNKATGEEYVYIGYKTTADKADAITDVSVMDMSGGFNRLNYRASLEAAAGNIRSMVGYMKAMCAELKTNLDAGALTAKLAERGLNLYTVPEAGNMKLTDYLTDSHRSDADYYDLVLKTNSTILSSVFNYLAIGTENPAGASWVQKLSDNGPEEMDYSDTAAAEKAGNLKDAVNDFAERCNAALARMAANGGALIQPDPNAEAVVDSSAAGNDSTLDGLEETDSDFIYVAAYRQLQAFPYGSGTLADLFTTGITDFSVLYPLAKVLTEGQYGAVCTTSILTLLINSYHTQQSYDDAMAKMNGTSLTFSIWTGVNTDVYDGEVGATAKAYRQMAAANNYAALSSTSLHDLVFGIESTIYNWAGIVSGCVYSFVAVIDLAAWGAGMYAAAFGQTCVTLFLSGLGHTLAVSTVASATNWALLAVTVILALVYAAVYLVDLYDYYHPDYTTIPGRMYDLKNDTDFIGYDAVTDTDGRAADLNAWSGQQWNALYVTKDTRAGSPIILGSTGNLFSVKYGDGTVPDGYRAVTMFGETNAADLNRHTYDPGTSIYLFCQTEDGQASPAAVRGKYLSAVALQTETTPEAAIYQLRNMGYEVLNVNLTEGLDRATYLGYQTNDSADLALTDLRIEYGTASGSILYGDSSYASCGTSGAHIDPASQSPEKGEYTLYATSSATAGDPILAADSGLLAVTGRLDLTSGYEPVSLFCSGAAFDFNTQEGEPQSSWETHVYLYFQPCVAYTGGTEYLAGLYFTNTLYQSSDAGSYCDTLGGTRTGYDFTSVTKIDIPSFTNMRLSYTSTYNPKRAITDIAFYTTNIGNACLPDCLRVVDRGYTACEVLTEMNLIALQKRTARITNAFKTGNSSDCGSDSVTSGLYVTGACSNCLPMTVSDFSLSDSASAPDGFSAIRNLTDYYERKPVDLSAGTTEYRHRGMTAVYLYVREDGKTPPAYIKSVSIGVSEADDYSADFCKLKLLNDGCDRIIDRDLNAEDDEDVSGYLGLTRTGNSKEAKITGFSVYYVKEGDTGAPESFKNSDGVTFSRVNEQGIPCGHDTTAYLYTATSPLLGGPVTDVSIDDRPYVQGMSTAVLCGRGDGFWYLHYTQETLKSSQTYITSVDVFSYASVDQDADYYKDGSLNFLGRAEVDENEAIQITMLLSGMRRIVDYDSLFRLDSDEYHYARYLATGSSLNKKNALTGLIAVRDAHWHDSLTVNGIVYYPISGRTSLNGNTDSGKICLYWTTDSKAGAKIVELKASGTADAGSGWNAVRDPHSSAVNVNTWKTEDDSDDYSTAACYLCYRRADNSIDPQSSLTASAFSDPTAFSLVLFSLLILSAGAAVHYERKKHSPQNCAADPYSE